MLRSIKKYFSRFLYASKNFFHPTLIQSNKCEIKIQAYIDPIIFNSFANLIYAP